MDGDVGELPVVGVGPVATVRVLPGPPGGRPVAIKVFPGPVDRFTRAAFDRERKALGTLTRISSILRIEAVREEPDGGLGLCMELCEQSLGQLLDAHGPLSVPDALAIGQAVATALAALHGAGLVHGAVTPRNVLLRANGEPVLADAGVALRRRHPRPPAPRTGWTAPETVRHGELTERTDLYGLGAVLYAALAGRSPFAGADTALDREDVPEPVRGLLSRLLAEDPARRPAAAAVLAETAAAEAAGNAAAAAENAGVVTDFDDFPGQGDRLPARQVGDRFFAEWDGGGTEPAVPAVPRRPSRRGSVLGIAAAFAVLVAVPVLAGRQPSPPSGSGPQAAAAPQPSTAGFVARTEHTIELDSPVDAGDAVQLSWRSEQDLEYAVVVAGESVPTKIMMVHRQHTVRVPVEPGRRYCFLVQGTDGRQVHQTAPRAIRGAVCKL